MRLEAVTERRWIIFFLALSNLAFIAVIHVAGTGAGYYGLSQARSASIRLRKLYVLNVQTPELPVADPDTAVDSFQITGWTGYLYLNGACIGPTNGRQTDAREGMIGARCQPPRIAEQYYISTKPNLTQNNILDPQIICYKNNWNASGDEGFGYELPCAFDEEASWPRYLISLTAPWSFFLLGTIGTLYTFMTRIACIRRRIPSRHVVDIGVAASTCFFFLIAAVLLTSDALNACNWVNGQHTELVFDARLGGTFFLLLWLMLAFSLTNLMVMVLQYHVKTSKRMASEHNGEDPPGYEAVTTQVSMSENELLRR